MSLRLGVSSDFHDYYDHHFCASWDLPEYLLFRQSRTELAKRSQFWLLTEAGFKTPCHGLVDYVSSEVSERRKRLKLDNLPAIALIVYLDEYAHCGDGKEFLLYYHARRHHPDAYCSEFIPTHPSPNIAVSQRLLYIGDHGFWLEYTGLGSWKSNHAPEVTIQRLDRPIPPRPAAFETMALVAVDFVADYQDGTQYAIDLNTAPGLKNTPIEDEIPAKTVVEWLHQWMVDQVTRTVKTAGE